MTKNESCVVLGVGPSTGNSISKRFSQAGYNLAIGSRNRSSLEPTTKIIENSGKKILAVTTHSNDEVSVKNLFKRSENELGPINIAIYNVSNFISKSVLETTSSELENVWKNTCFGGFVFAKEAISYMNKRSRGTIIFSGSTGGIRGSKNFSAFAMAQFGLRALAQRSALYSPKE